MGEQLRLRLDRPQTLRREDFILSPTNASALAILDAWPMWPGGALALVGPAGTGKSHLAMDWANRVGARVVRGSGETAPLIDFDGGPVLVDDADRLGDDETLFHLINMAARPGGGLLLTSRLAPKFWLADLPDLRSRLNALPVAELDEPDDLVLQGVLKKFFRELSIRPSEELISYLLRRIERSVPKAKEVVSRLDVLADQERRPVTRALARHMLGAELDAADLLDGL